MSEWLESHVPEKRWLMVPRRPFHILHMATESSRGDRAQPVRVIEKAKVFFNLNVTHIMPVTDVWRRDLFELLGYFALRRNLLVAAARFDAESNISCRSMCHNRLQRFLDPAQRYSGTFFPLPHGRDFFANIASG